MATPPSSLRHTDRRAAPDTSVSPPSIAHNLAAINLAQGDAPEAEAVYRDLIERQSRLQGPDHSITLGVRNALASTLTSQRKFAEAESVYRELLGPIEARSGGSGTAVATILVGLGENLTFLNRGEEAIPLLERALAILGDAYGEEDTRYARALERMVDARAAIGDDTGSETLHRRAVELVDAARRARASRGRPGDPIHVTLQDSLESVLTEARRPR